MDDEVPSEIPGCEKYLEFVAHNGWMSRTRFLDRHTTPYVVLTPETGEGLPYFLYKVAKRKGANTTPAITVGRADTNDIIVTDPGVSRIHAAFFPRRGGWTIADASASGTWVNGEKIKEKTHRILGASSRLQFGPALHASFLVPEKLFELVAKTLPR
ncbi:MAG: FHA domain-containing protein [Planctomycetota bacterium]